MLIQICDRCETRIPYPNPNVPDREYELYKHHAKFKSHDKDESVCLCDKCYSELIGWFNDRFDDSFVSDKNVTDDFIFWEDAVVSFIKREINQAGSISALSKKAGIDTSIISKIKNKKYIPNINFFKHHFPDSGLGNAVIKEVIII